MDHRGSHLTATVASGLLGGRDAIIEDGTAHSGRTRSDALRSNLTVGIDEAARLRCLAGSRMPSVSLQRIDATRFDLQSVSGDWVVFYLYPGTDTTPASGGDSPREDAAQHRAYSAREKMLRDLRIRPVGISSQRVGEQRKTICEHRIGHMMLIDPGLSLAEALGLPTFELAGRSWYRRLTLLTKDGVIERVFYPIASGANNPAQILTWLQLHG